MKRTAVPAALICLLLVPACLAYGHGGSSEIFPPTDLNGRQVTLEAASSQDNPRSPDRQISISFLDFDSKSTISDVTFHISAARGGQFLFEDEFAADNGFLVFNFVSEQTDQILLEEEAGGNLFGSLLGLDSRKIHVKGPKLSEGGLYRFDVMVLTADGYSQRLDSPLAYNVGISIPQTRDHTIAHPDYGNQTIQTITYYDELHGFDYDIQSKEIKFSMPFEWTKENIELTSVVHEELVIPKAFGDLLVSGFSMHINGVRLSDSIVSIDDFEPGIRTVHFIVNQKELLAVLEENDGHGIMDFMVRPSSEKTHLSALTDNGQFRLLVSWEPEKLESGSMAAVSFDVTDVFLKNLPVAVGYDFSVTQADRTIFQKSGFSTDSRDSHNLAEFMIPDDISGIVHLNFENLDGNQHAAVSVPIVVDSAVPAPAMPVPQWVRTNAGWWADGTIDDLTFIQGIQFLIENGIILVPGTAQAGDSGQEIPPWVRTNAGWWADGSINDMTFIGSLEFLIGQGILRVGDADST